MPSTKIQKKAPWDMTKEELVEFTAQFDREFVKTEPLTQEMRDRLKKAIRRPGRPRVGKGAKSISVTIEQTILDKADRFAQRIGISRAQLITSGIVCFMTGYSVGGRHAQAKSKKKAKRS